MVGYRYRAMEVEETSEHTPGPWAEYISLAKALLKNPPGQFVHAEDAYVAFRYIEPTVRLVFYPHRTTASNQHMRVRVEHCKDMARARNLLLQIVGGYQSPFGMKNKPPMIRAAIAKAEGQS
jgi:hypothetical protein